MCVAFLFLGHPPESDDDPSLVVNPYSFVLAVNRDEAYARPTRETHWWDDHPHILAGRDGEAGGTWLGITSEGRVAVLTNFTEAIADRQSHAPSRGKLPVDFLKQRGPDTQTPLEYLRHAVAPVRDAYNGFNLVVGDLKAGEFAYVGNRGAAAAASPLTLSSTSGVEGGVGVNSDDCGSGGVVYGLSNATLDTPWPKVEVGKARLREEMTRMASIKSAVPDLDATRVIERVLGNTGEWVEWEPEPGDGARGEGGTTGSSTPPPLHESWSTFVKPGAAPGRKGYGTRCSTVRARVVDSRDEELRRHDASGARLRTSITVDTWKRNLYMLLNLTICRACLYGEVIAVKRGGVGEGVGRGEVEMTERVLDCGSRKWRDAKTRFTIY